MYSLSDVDVERLSADARRALGAVQRIENRGESRETVLAELGLTETQLQRDVQQLAHEWAEQGGPTARSPRSSGSHPPPSAPSAKSSRKPARCPNWTPDAAATAKPSRQPSRHAGRRRSPSSPRASSTSRSGSTATSRASSKAPPGS